MGRKKKVKKRGPYTNWKKKYTESMERSGDLLGSLHKRDLQVERLEQDLTRVKDWLFRKVMDDRNLILNIGGAFNVEEGVTMTVSNNDNMTFTQDTVD